MSSPLVDIDYVIRHSRNVYEAAYVMLKCGHKTRSYGMYKVRCNKCAKGMPKDDDEAIRAGTD